MPPFEGLDAMNLRRRSSLYDNIVDEVNSYGSGLKERFHISFHSNREDVVATRDIIVGKHPLYEPGTPEWDEYVLGKDREMHYHLHQQHQQEHLDIAEEKTETPPPMQRQDDKTNTSQNSSNGSNASCNAPADVLEWLEIFTGMCLAPQNPKSSAPWSEPKETDASQNTRKVPVVPVRHTHNVEDADAMLKPIAQRARVLYPIAKYPSRLNSPRLVEQRRRFLENQIDFKPLRSEMRKPRKPRKYDV